MKKKLVTALLAVVMLVSMIPCAWADTALPDATLGQNYDQLLPGTSGAVNYWMVTFADGTVSKLPDGMKIEAPVNGGVYELHLTGAPTVAGYYNFQVGVLFSDGSSSNIAYSINVVSVASPSVPNIIASSDITCSQGSTFTVHVSASGNGTLSYQWYSSKANSYDGATPIAGAMSQSLMLSAAVAEEAYYFCVVTNTLSGSYVTGRSRLIHVSVTGSGASGGTARDDIFNVTRLTDPVKTEYKAGEKPDLTGISVSVQYLDGSSEVINDAAMFTIEPKTLSAKTTMLTVSYGGYSFMIPVSVKNSVELVAPPSKVNYKVGDTLDTSGMILRVFSGEGYNDISTGFTCSPSTLTRTGNQNITVIYEGDSVTFSVYVEAAAKDTKLEILTAPSKLQYNLGDTLDTTGLTLRLWTGNEYKDINYGFSCSPSVLNVAGESQEVTVRYGTASVTFTVSVNGEDVNETPKPSSTPSTVTVTPNAVGKDKNEKSGAPAAVLIIAIVIAGAALAGAITYISLLKKSREEQNQADSEDEFDAGEYFTNVPKASAPEVPAVKESREAHDDLAPDKTDYFEGLFDDK